MYVLYFLGINDSVLYGKLDKPVQEVSKSATKRKKRRGNSNTLTMAAKRKQQQQEVVVLDFTKRRGVGKKQKQPEQQLIASDSGADATLAQTLPSQVLN